jgi:chemotaxis family two-component system sensor kinase Cph1
MTSVAPAFGEATLNDCDLEKIDMPGAIQTHGVLLVVSEPCLPIRQVSANTDMHLGLTTDRLLGQALSLVVDPAGIAAIEAILTEDLVEPRYLPPLLTQGGQAMDAVIHRSDAGLILELEPSRQEPPLDIAGMVRRMLSTVHVAPSLLDACDQTTRGLREITGFDRVMIYRFLPDGAGTVIAEDRRSDLVTYTDGP